MNGPLLRLHGYAVSNYFNIAHAALIEVGARFEVVPRRASQDESFLVLSPMGKIPVLETEHGWLAETVAILEYLEDLMGPTGLYPADAFLRARARQIINVVQMYVEVPVRALFPGVFMGGDNDISTLEASRFTLDRSTAALRRLVVPRPYLLGESLGYADLFAFYCLDIAERVCLFVYQRSILAELGLEQWAQQVAGRDSSQRVLTAFDEAFSAYLVAKNATYPFEPTHYRTRPVSA
ncbi:glutathione S-transferase family protein [Pseudomonas sp. R3.Fl]|uniref:glutathione S-transferase family protein n=1 Tax=Pseudomonas TaxID=286 RepID=UPI00201E50B9|nr:MULTISPECIES: glutathione S-transferase family protein [unclassified Pseudomonas]MCL6692363.1 glutathione S-transferase family protein [Pseudomonas sp. R3.Fl]